MSYVCQPYPPYWTCLTTSLTNPTHNLDCWLNWWPTFNVKVNQFLTMGRIYYQLSPMVTIFCQSWHFITSATNVETWNAPNIILLFVVFTRVICSYEELSRKGLQNLIDRLIDLKVFNPVSAIYSYDDVLKKIAQFVFCAGVMWFNSKVLTFVGHPDLDKSEYNSQFSYGTVLDIQCIFIWNT